MSTTSPSRPRQAQSYLFFDGCCEEALTFYQRTLGATITSLTRFKDGPPPSDPGACPPSGPHGEKVMHAEFRIGATTLMASDGQCQGQARFTGFSLALELPDAPSAEATFGALAEGGQIQMPMTPTFFSPRFGMVADRFGVSWMVMAAHAPGHS